MIKVVCILVTVALSNMSVLLVLITTIKRPFKSGIHIVKLVSLNNQEIEYFFMLKCRRDIFCMLCDNQHPTTTREKASTCVTQLLRSTHWQPPECNELRCHMKPTLVESTDATKKLIVKVGSQLFNRLWVLLFGHIRTYFTRE
ncbi:hypothetical protein HanPSC8_Chr05g0186361 [Helianthus annuus]|nr:hypothetical protein HanPSC8_Chr05g0186361 [Helianthus annuus]